MIEKGIPLLISASFSLFVTSPLASLLRSTLRCGLRAIGEAEAAFKARNGEIRSKMTHFPIVFRPRSLTFPPIPPPPNNPGITSENVAARYGVGRDVQDKLAARSHARAAAAQASGRFRDEIVPVKTKIIDPKTEEEKAIVVTDDDGIRPGVTVQSLGQLRTVFKKDGTTTAGNSSQVRICFFCFGRGEVEVESPRSTTPHSFPTP